MLMIVHNLLPKMKKQVHELTPRSLDQILTITELSISQTAQNNPYPQQLPRTEPQINSRQVHYIFYIQTFIREARMASCSDRQYAMIQFTRTFQQYKNEKLTLESFSDGWIFLTILGAASGFKIRYGEMGKNCAKWTHKLANLKKIIAYVEEYFEQHIKKGIKTKDIDLIEIARRHSVEQILKLFEAVIAALTEAANKQDHINTIMSLDQRSQSSFVSIIQDVLQNRIIDKNDSHENRVIETIHQLQTENSLLRVEVQNLLKENGQLEKQIEQFKNSQADYEQQLRKIRDQEMDTHHIQHEDPREKEHMKHMIENLKEKLISTVRQHEIKVAGLKEEITILESRNLRYEEMEEELEDYKRKFAETLESQGRARGWEKEKAKLTRTITEKDEIIKKLNAKLDEANELNFAMQQREVYAKMELQKRDVRFKQLQKQVKKKYSAQQPGLASTQSAKSLNHMAHSAILSNQINEINQQQVDELKTELQQVKKRNREADREINKLKRTVEKMNTIEAEKKKLERIILDVSVEKKQQVQVLLSTTYDFYAENERLRGLLNKHNIIC